MPKSVPRINYNCGICNKEITLTENIYKRKIETNKAGILFCSRICVSNNYKNKNIKNLEKANNEIKLGLKKRKKAKSRIDQFSPFRLYLNGSKYKSKKHKNIDLDLQYLKDLFENQNGCCALTNIPLILLPNTFYQKIYGKTPMNTASLDRIDSNKEYQKGNVQFVCKAINFAKNVHSQQETIEFINSIIKNFNNERFNIHNSRCE